jgi:acetoin utilization deacetylase AcuC-like enzyme
MCGNKSKSEWCYVNQIDGDTTYISPHTQNVIKRMSYMIKEAIKQQMIIKNNFTMCLTRPPGHHACTNHIAGFCHKNFAIEALDYLTNTYNKKCLILDIDAHYGDGTVEELMKRDYGKYVSIHGFGKNIYPGTGDYLISDRICSLPLPSNATSEVWLNKFKTEGMKFIVESGCEMIILSAGFDGHKDDRIAPLNLDTELYYTFGKYLKEIKLPVLGVLEGGYELSVLGKSVSALINGFNETN